MNDIEIYLQGNGIAPNTTIAVPGGEILLADLIAVYAEGVEATTQKNFIKRVISAIDQGLEGWKIVGFLEREDVQ